ncbi:MAG TPA: PQQ-binding-like beta-propeller repeat protein [Planctomycetaceae bacterium]|nr:PQQ-binding-like beta-propeller repeat protein [Planctomycetaceae bacterium]
MIHSPHIGPAVSRRLRLCFLLICTAADFGVDRTLSAAENSAAVDPMWMHLYVRNRRQSAALAAASELAASGRIPEFTAQLQWVLDQPHDSWIVDPNGQLVSVRDAVERLFESQGVPVYEQYRRTLGPAAAQELARAASSPDSVELFQIVRRYAATDAGLQAADRLLSRWLDEGAWRRASDLGLRLIHDERRTAAISPDLVRRTWLACRLAGRDDEAAALEEQFADSGLLSHRDSGDQPEPAETQRWLGPGGDFRRNAHSTASPPLLVPRWSQLLKPPAAYPKAAETVSRWLDAQQEQDQPAAIGWTPVLAGDRLVFRDFDSVFALDAFTGAPRWRFRTGAGLASLLNSATDDRSISRRPGGAKWELAMANSLLGGVSTDGRRVYALDQYEPFVQATAGGLESREFSSTVRRTSARNALVALDLAGDNDADRLVWSTAEGALRETWSGHAFLGPPLPFEGWLYAISETDRELQLSAVDPATGQPLWQQPIAEVERSVVEDRGRYLRACSPSIAGGLVLCPTNIGLLVAVDALTGQLRWVHNSLTTEESDTRGAAVRLRTPPATVQRRHPAFAPLVHVIGDRAVYLPSHQAKAYCLSTTTGRVLWDASIPEAEYIGIVTDAVVLIVGRTQCRGLSLADGTEQWKRPLSAPPSGFGLSRGSTYLLPLGDGHLVELNLTTGEPIGYQFRTVAEPLGHLVPTREAILSVGATGVTAYPQTATVRRQIQWEQATKGADPVHALRLAEILLTEGDLSGAIRQLEACRAALPRGGEVAAQAEDLLRKSYQQALVNDDIAAETWLAKLKPLCRTPQDRMQWQVAASDRALSQDQMDQLVPLLSDLAALPVNAGIAAVPGDTGLAVSPRVWLRLLGDRAVDEAQRETLLTELRGVTTPDRDDLAGAAIAFAVDGSDWAVTARWHQARAARGQGDWHRAECLLWRDATGDSAGAARACLELAQLYESAGLLSLAGRMLDVLATKFATMPSADGRPYAQVVAEWPQRGGGWVGWKKRQPIGRPVRRVTFAALPADELALGRAPIDVAIRSANDERYGGYLRPVFSPAKPDAALDWMMQHRELNVVYGVFDRPSAQKIAEFELPLGTQLPNPMLPQTSGSGLAFGLPAELRMLSPLQGSENGRVWSATLPDWQGHSGLPQVGSASSRFVLMQLKNELAAVDAADGALLWRRSGLPSGSGLYGSPRNGLSADDDYVVVLESGREEPGYRVFHAATGRLHRQGALPSRISMLSQPRGRLQIYKTADALPRLRVWDPATDTLLVDDALSLRPLIDAANATHLAWVSQQHRLQVYDYEQRRMAVNIPLTDKDLERVTSIKTFRQAGRYYVTMQSDQPTAKTEHFHNALPQESLISATSVRDEFLAIDPASQRILWRQPQPQCSVVQWGELPVPVLVAISTIRDKRNQNRRWLQIQALDPDTGQRLGDGGEMPIDAILSADYDGQTGCIRLLGRRTTYELKLRTQRLGLEELPAL